MRDSICYLIFISFVVDTGKIAGVKSPAKMVCSKASEEEVKYVNICLLQALFNVCFVRESICYLTFVLFVVDTGNIAGVKSPVKMLCSKTSKEEEKSGNICFLFNCIDLEVSLLNAKFFIGIGYEMRGTMFEIMFYCFDLQKFNILFMF